MLFYLAPVLLLSLQASAPEARAAETATTGEDATIVVTAQRLRKFRARVKTRSKTGELYCDLRRSSGDAAFDRGFCAQLVRCHGVVDRTHALQEMEERGASRKELERAATQELERCITPFFEKYGIDQR